MAPHASDLISCELVAERPTTIAEVVCGDREGAENIIAMFNNQRVSKHVNSRLLPANPFKADGRQLYVYMKNGPPAPVHRLNYNKTEDRRDNHADERRNDRRSDPAPIQSQPVQPTPQRSDEADFMELEETQRPDEGQSRSRNDTQPISSYTEDRGSSSYQGSRYGDDARDHRNRGYDNRSRDYRRPDQRQDRNFGRMRGYNGNSSSNYGPNRRPW